MKVLIVEDEELSAERLSKLVTDAEPEVEILGIFASVFETINYLEKDINEKPDLIFLDIHLEDGDGFEIVQRLNLLIPIIFTTAYDSYTLKAFKTSGVDYLLKPVKPLELQAALIKFKKLFLLPKTNPESEFIPSNTVFKERFLCSAGTNYYTFETSEIAYFIIEHRSTFLRLFDGRHFAIDFSLDKLVQMIDPDQFFRINRKLLISLRSIGSMQFIAAGKFQLELLPATSESVFVSSDLIPTFKTWLGK
jgi:DNA-binding LytR/AlgR family response regulator